MGKQIVFEFADGKVTAQAVNFTDASSLPIMSTLLAPLGPVEEAGERGGPGHTHVHVHSSGEVHTHPEMHQ